MTNISTEARATEAARTDWTALAVMVGTPLAFASNAAFGRVAVESVNPFTLAFLRWLPVTLILLPFAWHALATHREALREHWRLTLFMGFLGQFICGGIFYLALTMTTAANGILIYSSVPAMIVLIERIFLGRALVHRQLVGIAMASVGIVYIMTRGSWHELVAFRFNLGDAIVLGTSLSWAVYSILLRRPVFAALPNVGVLALFAMCGAALLLPAAAVEIAATGKFPVQLDQWRSIAAIVLISSITAFLGYQFGVRRLGAAVASAFMYLLPVYGIFLAWFLVGERIYAFHYIGTALVLAGVVLASMKAKKPA
ncbi:MAG: DMT family transporter [Pseudomonadota bacterium]